MIADFIYQLTPRDFVGQGHSPAGMYQVVTGSTLAAVSARWVIPNDLNLLLKTAWISATPAATLSCTNTSFSIRNAQGTDTQVVLFNTAAGAANQVILIERALDVLVPHGAMLQGTVEWSAGNAGNIAQFSWSGLLIPRGNVQSFRKWPPSELIA